MRRVPIVTVMLKRGQHHHGLQILFLTCVLLVRVVRGPLIRHLVVAVVPLVQMERLWPARRIRIRHVRPVRACLRVREQVQRPILNVM